MQLPQCASSRFVVGGRQEESLGVRKDLPVTAFLDGVDDTVEFVLARSEFLGRRHPPVQADFPVQRAVSRADHAALLVLIDRSS
jgi:hypothetical protein